MLAPVIPDELPNKSINPTAGYGLSRFRISAPAAAGYLQRYKGFPVLRK